MEPSIPTSKQSFLTTQLKLLNTSLSAPAQSPLPKPATDTLLEKVNKKITQQTRLSFPIESQIHVVEQIDSLYWRDVLSAGLPVRKAETILKKDDDLITLPERWEDVVLKTGIETSDKGDAEPKGTESTNDAETHDERLESGIQDLDSTKYTQLRVKLQTQQALKEDLERKIEGYRKLQDLLKVFEKPQENIQPNLVTRDNKELEDELAKMRVLLARAGDKVQKSDRVEVEEEEYDARAAKVRKLDAVLELG